MDSSESAGGDDVPVSLLLDGLEAGADLLSVHQAVGDLFRDSRTRSPRGLLELAASAFTSCGSSSEDPLVLDELEQRYLPE